MKKHFSTIIAIGILVFIAMACNASFTTANISSLNFGKNEKAEPPTTTFDVGDRVHAVAVVSNSMSKSKVRFKIFFDNVEGKPKGGEAGTTDVDMAGSNGAFTSFNAVAPGTYKIDATLLDEDGKEIDKKSGTVTVKGSAPTTTTEKPKDSTDADKDKDADSDDK